MPEEDSKQEDIYTDQKAIADMVDQIFERKRRNPLEGWNPEP